MKLTLLVLAIFAAQLSAGFSQLSSNQLWLISARSNEVVFLDTNKMYDPANLAAARAAYQAGQIRKRAMNIINERVENITPQDFYGKIVDQRGEPVADVSVSADARVWPRIGDGAEYGYASTHSDAAGRFQITGLKGRGLEMAINKKGYLVDVDSDNHYPIDNLTNTSPDNRGVVVIWKGHDGLPAFNCFTFNGHLRGDGTAEKRNLASQNAITRLSISNGVVQFTLLRSPLRLRKGEKFDWKLKIEVLGGGLVPENDQYPYWATNSGYQPEFEMNMSSNNPAWHGLVQQNFYITNAQGLYGQMDILAKTGQTPPSLQCGVTINYTGSRDLQPFMINH